MRLKPLLLFLGYLLAVALVLEIACRTYWKIARGADFAASPKTIAHQIFYPELKRVDEVPPSDGLGVVPTILLLGASTFHPDFGAIEISLRNALIMSGKPARIINLAMPAHSTRDSYLKYRFLEDHHFDLVIVYHGINEVRANNCPAELFRNDYSHYSWYEAANRLAGDSPALRSVLGFTLTYLGHEMKVRLDPDAYVPQHDAKQEWLDHGSQIKTASSFSENLEKIIQIAERRREKLLLMTFAYYLAPNYTEEAMAVGALDYTYRDYSYPVESWGRPENVVAGISAHNRMVRVLATAHPNVLFVDQERLMEPLKTNFVDICHFTKPGSRRFVKSILPEVLRALDAPPASPAR